MKTTTHKTITRLATQICKDRLSDEMGENFEMIIQGSEEEDTTELKKRSMNWHFYRSNGNIPEHYKKLGMNFRPTSEHIFSERIGDMSGYGRYDQRRYNYLGRIIHHIQDMSTPSHIIPIYHGPKFPLKLSMGYIKDHFEDFIERNDERVRGLELDEVPDIDSTTTLYTLYRNSADDMLKNILKMEDPIEDRPYSLFWKHSSEKEHKRLKGFGVYGKGQKYFKKNIMRKSNNDGVTEEMLFDLQDTITKHALISTCRALQVADRIR